MSDRAICRKTAPVGCHARPADIAIYPCSTRSRHCSFARARSGQVKGFGCRPVVTYPAVLGAGVRKPPRKEPAGNRCAVCRLWGFGCAEIHVKFALPRPTQLARSTERLFEHLAMNLVYLVMLHVNASSRSVPGLATDHDVAHCA